MLTQRTHGFYPKVVNIDACLIVRDYVNKFLHFNQYPTYTSNVGIEIPLALELISPSLEDNIKYVLQSNLITLENIELHYQPPSSIPIPPHQDNFYHCIERGEGLKLLIPLTPLSPQSGSLSFLNCPSSIGVLPHSPSNVANFSSFIPSRILDRLDFSTTVYEYALGDASYHLLNSVHSSNGNSSAYATMFLVYRYHIASAIQSSTLLKQYHATYNNYLLNMQKRA